MIEVLGPIKEGYFVDLAASDGVTKNNTLYMERILNWSGICIEPNPYFHKVLKANRQCLILDVVVDKSDNEEIEFRVDNDVLGGIVAEDTDNNYRVRGHALRTRAKIVKMKTKTLETLLDDAGAPKVIDYLSLDVEGAESRILMGFPFDKYTFLTMTIERPTPELEQVLFANGYVFVRKSGDNRDTFDTYYVHSSIPNFESIKKETYSPTPKKDW